MPEQRGHPVGGRRERTHVPSPEFQVDGEPCGVHIGAERVEAIAAAGTEAHGDAPVATQMGGDVTVLVAGEGCDGVAQAAAKVQGVAKVLLAQDADYVDLDGPLLLARDRDPGLVFDGSVIAPPSPALWG